jgi:hypothetical protein
VPKPLPLQPLVGNMWVPVWAIRPGSYGVLEGLTAEMPLWLLLHSRNADYWKPSYATREQIVATIGGSVRNLSRQFGRLREAGLLFEVDRGEERGNRRHRPPARWALDPFTADLWGSKWDDKGERLPGQGKIEAALAEIAESDGQSRQWFEWAIRELDKFERASRYLADRIADDIPIKPRKASKRKRRNKKQTAMSHLAPRARVAHEGVFIPPHPEPTPHTTPTDIEVVEVAAAARSRKEPPSGGREHESEEAENIGRPAASDDQRNAA